MSDALLADATRHGLGTTRTHFVAIAEIEGLLRDNTTGIVEIVGGEPLP
ncbi:MAG: hypothetical protein KTU85_00110 [Acidimicrobiia bacterium]|nr:hypothetical protein [Acidimicrobiia bacterium]